MAPNLKSYASLASFSSAFTSSSGSAASTVHTLPPTLVASITPPTTSSWQPLPYGDTTTRRAGIWAPRGTSFVLNVAPPSLSGVGVITTKCSALGGRRPRRGSFSGSAKVDLGQGDTDGSDRGPERADTGLNGMDLVRVEFPPPAVSLVQVARPSEDPPSQSAPQRKHPSPSTEGPAPVYEVRLHPRAQQERFLARLMREAAERRAEVEAWRREGERREEVEKWRRGLLAAVADEVDGGAGQVRARQVRRVMALERRLHEKKLAAQRQRKAQEATASEAARMEQQQRHHLHLIAQVVAATTTQAPGPIGSGPPLRHVQFKAAVPQARVHGSPVSREKQAEEGFSVPSLPNISPANGGYRDGWEDRFCPPQDVRITRRAGRFDQRARGISSNDCASQFLTTQVRVSPAVPTDSGFRRPSRVTSHSNGHSRASSPGRTSIHTSPGLRSRRGNTHVAGGSGLPSRPMLAIEWYPCEGDSTADDSLDVTHPAASPREGRRPLSARRERPYTSG